MFNKDLIEKYMNEKGWTKYRLAKESNIGQSTLSEILSGKKKNPSINTLQKIANALEVPVDFISGESAKSIIYNKLAELSMTIEELSEKSGVPKVFFANLDNIQPDEQDYDYMNSIGRVLNIQPIILCSALSKQEPPMYEGPRITAKEAFDNKPIDKINKTVKDSGINTIAAHFEDEEFTEDDKEDIENFIKYVLSKKKKK